MIRVRRVALPVAASLAALAAVTASAQKPDAGGTIADEGPETLPPDFRGRITYRGTHEAALDRGGRRGSRQYGGALTVELTFDGNAVTGRFSGTGGINSGTMSGTRNGSHCRLFEQRAGDIVEGECTRTRFSAEARSQGSRNAMAAAFEAQATHLVDAVEEERQQRLAAQQERERAIAAAREAERQRPAAAPAIRQAQTRPSPARPAATASSQARSPSRAAGRRNGRFSAQLVEALRQDSRSWSNNRLHAGTERDSGTIGNEEGGVVYRVEYRFSGFFDGPDAPGWVEGLFLNGSLAQIRYHDNGQWSAVRTDLTRRQDHAEQASRARERCVAENQWRLIPGQFC